MVHLSFTLRYFFFFFFCTTWLSHVYLYFVRLFGVDYDISDGEEEEQEEQEQDDDGK